MSTTQTRTHLIEAVASQTDLTKPDVTLLIETLLKLIFQNLTQGKTIKIPNFGSFMIRLKAARPGRNPRTGSETEVSERRVVTFRPSLHLRKRIANTA
jgi:integration host factor subunit alpha